MTGRTRVIGRFGLGGLLVVFLLGLGAEALPGQALRVVAPASKAMNPALLDEIPGLVAAAIEKGNIPGAVVLVGRGRELVYRKAFGHRALEPRRERMTLDSVFDLASLTKCLATTSAVLKLIEAGKIDRQAKLGRYLPSFAKNGKEAITVEMLLRHRGGLTPDNHLRDYLNGPKVARKKIEELGLRAPAGSKYIYTDVGFILLGWIVEAVSGMPLDRYVEREVFRPLGMKDTRYLRTRRPVSGALRRRCVPTERAGKGRPFFRGRVHDPRARHLGGVAGHAGLFSTGDDVARYAMMLLDDGRDAKGRAFFRPETVRALRDPGGLPVDQARGLGWDLRPARPGKGRAGGRIFPADSFGHTGFTGTSLWMDPRTRCFVLILSSRLHPDGKGSVGRLRSEIADRVARSLRDAPWGK